MGFRPHLDLSQILDLHKESMPSREEAEELRKPRVPDEGLKYESPVRLGWGPARWSTSTALVPVERVCHDVNGYYRELGVDWRASRKELKEAYMALDGQGSARLTYVFKQLLDPLTREAYDKSPKGSPFLDDYTEDDLKRRAHEEAGRRSAMGQKASSQDVLGEWGYVVLDDEEPLDTVRGMGQDLPQHKAKRREPWGYSYYAWQTERFVQDESRLRAWQELLSSADKPSGSCPEIAIGLTSSTRMSDLPFMIEMVGNVPVVFFSTEQEPNLEVASQAISRLLEFS